MKTFNSFSDFYVFYLNEHKNKGCKIMHFIGTSCVFFITIYSIFTKQYQTLFVLPLFGYGFAWIGHFIFEKNKPATFKHPFYSLLGDFVMYKDLLTGKLSFKSV